MLPRICQDLEPIQGDLRREKGDYQVQEQLLRNPSGNGDYLWVQVRQADISSKQVAAALARSVNIDPRLVRYAASRDRKAEIYQWYSLPAEQVEHVQALKNAGYKKLLKVKQVERSKYPIDKEQIKNLSYTVRIRNAVEDGGYLKARAILDKLRQQGCPNYIGFARMGPKGQYAKWGKMIVQGKRLPRQVPNKSQDLQRYTYAYQSQICNRYIAQRIEHTIFSKCVVGDVLQTQLAKPVSERSLTIVEDQETGQRRIDSWEAVVCAPLIGEDMQSAQDEALLFEENFFKEVNVKNMYSSTLSGGRRPIRVQPTQVSCDDQRNDLIVKFTLDADVYASNILEELLQPEYHII